MVVGDDEDEAAGFALADADKEAGVLLAVDQLVDAAAASVESVVEAAYEGAAASSLRSPAEEPAWRRRGGGA